MIETRRRHGLCFANIVEGDLASPARERCESALFARLRESRIPVMMVAVNEVGCVFAVDHHDLERLLAAVQRLNVALRVRSRCARVALSHRGGDPALPQVSHVIAALADAGIGIVHLSSDVDALSVLVDERDAGRAAGVMARCCMLASRRAA